MKTKVTNKTQANRNRTYKSEIYDALTDIYFTAAGVYFSDSVARDQYLKMASRVHKKGLTEDELKRSLA